MKDKIIEIIGLEPELADLKAQQVMDLFSETLTHQQIETVLRWMETYGRLSGTDTPAQFKEEFTHRLSKSEKSGNGARPPIGVIPRWLWKEQRKQELFRAIVRYMEESIEVPEEWMSEYYEYPKWQPPMTADKLAESLKPDSRAKELVDKAMSHTDMPLLSEIKRKYWKNQLGFIRDDIKR